MSHAAGQTSTELVGRAEELRVLCDLIGDLVEIFPFALPLDGNVRDCFFTAI